LRSVFFLLLDKPEFLKKVWEGFNHISAEAMMGEGRVYGAGLHNWHIYKIGILP
jgi:hypothetical protein